MTERRDRDKGGQGRRAWGALLWLVGGSGPGPVWGRGLLQSALEQEGPRRSPSQRMEWSRARVPSSSRNPVPQFPHTAQPRPSHWPNSAAPGPGAGSPA